METQAQKKRVNRNSRIPIWITNFDDLKDGKRKQFVTSDKTITLGHVHNSYSIIATTEGLEMNAQLFGEMSLYRKSFIVEVLDSEVSGINNWNK
jgi:hypothetical protein